jgi:hypothetical protein
MQLHIIIFTFDELYVIAYNKEYGNFGKFC